MAKGEGGGGHWRERQLAKKASVSRRPDTPEVLAAIVKPKAKPAKPKAKIRVPKWAPMPMAKPRRVQVESHDGEDIPLTPPNRAAMADQLQRPTRWAKTEGIPLTPPNRAAMGDMMQHPTRWAMDDAIPLTPPNRMAKEDQYQRPNRVAKGPMRLKDIARVPSNVRRSDYY